MKGKEENPKVEKNFKKKKNLDVDVAFLLHYNHKENFAGHQ